MAEARSEKHKVIEYVIKHENLQVEQKSGKIRQYNNDLPRHNAEKRDEALAELDGQLAYEIMLAELLLKTLR